jgi:hypothetical protein
MVNPTRRPARAASALAAVAALGLASAWTATASAQNTFNPYLPYNADLYNFVVPTQPTNLALPGAAREAAAFDSIPGGGGISRFNSFDRWLDNYESDMARGRRTGSGSVDRNDPNRYIPNREADRGFYEREGQRDNRLFEAETTRARIARERDRYYAAASRERDPARRAAYLKVVAALANPKTAEGMLRDIDEAEAERQRPAQTRRPAEDRRPAANGSGAFSRSILRNPAMGPAPVGPANPGPKPSATTTPPASIAAPSTGRIAGPVTASPSTPQPAATTPNRGTSVKLPDTVPPMPREESKPAKPATPSSPAPPGPSDSPAPVPLPDTAPPPPR